MRKKILFLLIGLIILITGCSKQEVNSYIKISGDDEARISLFTNKNKVEFIDLEIKDYNRKIVNSNNAIRKDEELRVNSEFHKSYEDFDSTLWLEHDADYIYNARMTNIVTNQALSLAKSIASRRGAFEVKHQVARTLLEGMEKDSEQYRRLEGILENLDGQARDEFIDNPTELVEGLFVDVNQDTEKYEVYFDIDLARIDEENIPNIKLEKEGDKFLYRPLRENLIGDKWKIDEGDIEDKQVKSVVNINDLALEEAKRNVLYNFMLALDESDSIRLDLQQKLEGNINTIDMSDAVQGAKINISEEDGTILYNIKIDLGDLNKKFYNTNLNSEQLSELVDHDIVLDLNRGFVEDYIDYGKLSEYLLNDGWILVK